MGKYSVEDFAFGGEYKDYCWDLKYNPNATIENGLANCTTLAIAFSYILHNPYPVTRIGSANNWHRLLTNGWTYKPYGSVMLKVGDILEWKDEVHVATVIAIKEGEALLGCSWYTGEHGVSKYDGVYDSRSFSSLKEMCDFFVTKYPYRFYHEASLYEESQKVGGMPKYVLVAPEKVNPVEENKYVDQIQVFTDVQNIRDGDNNIVGVAQKGFYNVLATKTYNGYIWYMVSENRYIAGVKGRVEFIPSSADIEKLEEEIVKLKSALTEIDEIVKKYL